MTMGRMTGRVCLRIVAVALAAALAACEDTPPPSAPSPNNPLFTQRDLRVGTGVDAESGKTITVHYTGWLFDESRPDQKGLQFETSVGRDPFTFVLGAGQVIAGWDQGLVGMKVGGIRRLVIPSSLAYGGFRNGPIPPYATLVFEIELIDIPVEAGTPYTIGLRAGSGQFLSVENNGNALVQANKSSMGPWETFRLLDVNGGALVSGDTVRIETTSGWGFAPTAGSLGAVVSPGQSIVEEQFVIEATGPIASGVAVTLRTVVTSLYVGAEGGGGGAVVVRSTTIGPWETFTLIMQ
jgi:FKBP-type peptidyl-prolyl cis-trans isomerase FkpA